MKWSLITHYHINRYACNKIVLPKSVADTQKPVVCLDVGEHMTFHNWCVSLLGDSRLRIGHPHSVKTCRKGLLINMSLDVINEMYDKEQRKLSNQAAWPRVA